MSEKMDVAAVPFFTLHRVRAAFSGHNSRRGLQRTAAAGRASLSVQLCDALARTDLALHSPFSHL